MDDSARPSVRDDLVVREVDGEFFVYDPISDRVVLLNGSAAAVVPLCDGTRTPGEITAEVAEAFEVERAQVEDDIHTTLTQFATSGVLERKARDARDDGRK